MQDYIALHAKLQPNRLAIHELATDRKWTYAALDIAVGQCAAVLQCNYSLVYGDRIATLARNCAEHVILHSACARTGLIYVPLNWRLSPAELSTLIDDCEPSLILGDDFLDAIDTAVPRLSFKNLIEEIEAQNPLPEQTINHDDPSLILYTSGTSGKPKGVLLSENNLEQTAYNFSIFGRVTHTSVFLCDAPMFHILGLISNVRPLFLRGGALLISDAFEAKRTLQRLADPELRVTHYFSVPQMAAMLRQEPGFDPNKLRGMTAIFTGGAPHPKADICAWLDDGLTIVDGFGMSETGSNYSMPLEQDIIRAKAGSIGVHSPDIQSRIVNSRDEDCAIDAPGELLLKGRGISKGYWRQPEATALAFTKDGWFRTGDIATCDADGFYYIVDRKKDMFISGGENVYPAEIEAALAGMEGIKEVAVIGVPDERWGEVGHAVLALKAGHTMDLAAILKWLEPRLARYKLPKKLSIVDALPRTGSGKVRKNILRKQFS